MRDVQEVTKMIEKAFTDTPYPGDKNLGWSHEGDAIEDDFRGKHWRNVPLAMINKYRGDLSYFTAGAFRFYLPAFMLAVLPHPTEVDTLTINILSSLTPPEALFADRQSKKIIEDMMKNFSSTASAFNQEEIATIIAFLETYMQLYEEEYQVIHLKLPEKAIAFWKSKAK